MLLFAFCALTITTAVFARPNIDVDTQNVVTVPPNCPPGQEWINGECREIWRNVLKNDKENRNYEIIDPQNIVTVPPNCKPGQQWINGQCRDIWRSDVSPANVVTVPPNCPAGQEFINGVCRDVWIRQKLIRFVEPKLMAALLNYFGNDGLERLRRQLIVEHNSKDIELDNRNIISVPNQCPIGYKPDALGICREIFQY